MSIGTVNDVKVQKQSGVVMVSLSKVIEISTDRLAVLCIDVNDFELDCLDSIFLPTPRDEIIREMVLDVISVSQDDSHVEAMFEIVEDLSGEHITKIKREDYETWAKTYKKEFSDIVLDAIDKDADNTKLNVEVAIMANVDNLAFILIAESESQATALLEHQIDDYDDDEVLDDYEDEMYDEEDI